MSLGLPDLSLGPFHVEVARGLAGAGALRSAPMCLVGVFDAPDYWERCPTVEVCQTAYQLVQFFDNINFVFVFKFKHCCDEDALVRYTGVIFPHLVFEQGK